MSCTLAVSILQRARRLFHDADKDNSGQLDSEVSPGSGVFIALRSVRLALQELALVFRAMYRDEGVSRKKATVLEEVF